MFSPSVYTTFLSVPVNATQVHIINRAPLFTHMGECCFEMSRFLFIYFFKEKSQNLNSSVCDCSRVAGKSLRGVWTGHHGGERDLPIGSGWGPPWVSTLPQPGSSAWNGRAADAWTTAQRGQCRGEHDFIPDVIIVYTFHVLSVHAKTLI